MKKELTTFRISKRYPDMGFFRTADSYYADTDSVLIKQVLRVG